MNCNKCIPRKNTAEELDRVEALRKANGCREDASTPQYGDDETGELVYRCPVSMLTPEALSIIEVLNMIELGFLPRAGGAYDQDAYTMARVQCARNIKIRMLKKKEK